MDLVAQTEYDAVISLGYNCACAYQIRLHLRVAEPYFFDWLYTSIDAASSVLESKFTGVMQKANCSLVRNNTEIFDNANGLRFNHSFKTNGQSIDQEAFDRDFSQEASKFAYLGSKTLATLMESRRTLFIRWNPYRDRRDSPAQVKRLRVALDAINPAYDLWVVLNAEPGMTGLSAYHANFGALMVDLPNDPRRSRSFHGGSFVGSDDVSWGELLRNVAVNTKNKKKLAPGEPVLPKTRLAYD